MNDSERARYIIEHNVHMIVATSGSDGMPWVSPVFFVCDEDHALYWVSSKHARHSDNIRQRAQVGIVILDPSPDRDVDAVFFDALAEELDDQQAIEHAIAVLRGRPQPVKSTTERVEDVTGDAAWRIYRAVPQEITRRADAEDPASGQAITVRRPVVL
jgi:nitroimidazol reductase NimA-like FMN-containing flavoprotein (pyridoxamine 5'-phosphate oxidase superfamily)